MDQAPRSYKDYRKACVRTSRSHERPLINDEGLHEGEIRPVCTAMTIDPNIADDLQKRS